MNDCTLNGQPSNYGFFSKEPRQLPADLGQKLYATDFAGYYVEGYKIDVCKETYRTLLLIKDDAYKTDPSNKYEFHYVAIPSPLK